MAPADSEVSVGAVARTDHAEALRVEVDPWRVAQRRLDAAQAARDETVFALANGALGVRGGVEEIDSPTQATFLAGVWERTQIHYHERHPGFARSTDTRVP